VISSRIRRNTAWLGLRAVIATVFMLTFAATLHAQVVSDPRLVECDPSPDEWAVLSDGQPAVSRYDLEVYMVAASAPFAVVDMGNPPPESDGKIRHDFSQEVASWSLPGGDYEARVKAVGPQGAGTSAPSNRFTFTVADPCVFTVAPTSVSYTSTGGGGSVTITAGATCNAWSASNLNAWLTPAAASGTGSGTVTFTASANSGAARSGTVTVAGQTVSVSQAAAPPCAFTVSPTSLSYTSSGGQAAVTIAAGTTCAWSVTEDARWLRPSVTSGTGPSTVTFRAARNSGQARSTTVTVAGRAVSVSQASRR
jgi:Putative binding domain, N-terminal